MPYRVRPSVQAAGKGQERCLEQSRPPMPKRSLPYPRLLLLLACALVVASCSGSETSSPTSTTSEAPAPTSPAAPPPSSVPATGTAVRGVVVQSRDGQIHLVDALGNAGGASPVAGATIQLVDLRDNVLATLRSDNAGAFTVSNLNADKVQIEVRTDPTAAVPDAVAAVSLAAGSTIAVGASYPVSRDAAINIVQGLAPPDALIAGTFNPLPGGTIVAPAFGDENGALSPMSAVHQVASEGEYLFLIDPTPEAAWGHDCQYVFVNAQTGQTTTQPAFWWPAVNGVMYFNYGGELLTPAEEFPDIIPGHQTTVSNELVALPRSPSPSASTAVRAQATRGGRDRRDSGEMRSRLS